MSEQELEIETEEEDDSLHGLLSDAFDESSETEEVEEPGIIEYEDDHPELQGEAQPAAEVNAPQSWGVAEREGWANLPPEIQAQINKREQETQQALTNSGEARKFHEEFNSTVQPYLGFIQAEGGTPMSAFSTLMQTAATLQAGAPQQKAQRIAELIGHYGVDIHVLDSLLAGQVPESNDENRFAQMLDQRLQPMMNTLNQFQQSQQQAVQDNQQQTHNQINDFFGQNEFAPDVRMEMADLMEMAGRRGEAMDLSQAYEKALLLRPDIQQVIQQRNAAINAQQGNQQIQQKQNAAVSVAGGAALQGGKPAPTSMRDALSAAFDGE